MIKSIQLQNFQSHLSSKLEFEKGINIISGSSNNGKSSIIKALNWVVNGEPNGNDIINYDEKECRVKLEIDNNTIEKVKSDKLNQYIINNKDPISTNKSVPEDIKKLNFNDLNLQMQFDRFFLLQNSSGEVARKLNKIVNLDDIDITIKKTKSKVNEKKRYIDNMELTISELKTKIKKYDNLDIIEKIVIKLEDLENRKNTLIEQNNVLIRMQKELLVYQSELERYKNIDKKKTIVNKLKKQLNSYELFSNKLQKIKGLKNEYDNNLIELEKYKNNDIKKEIINKLKILINDYIEKYNLLYLLSEYRDNKNQVKQLENKIYNIKQMKSRLLPKGGVCPVCKKII